MRFTERKGDAARMAREAATGASPPTCVAACGGDGTIQEVAGALAEARSRVGDGCPSLGLAPAGRCNDFARALGVPREVKAIAEILARGVPKPTDLGVANGRWFCTVATLGIDAEVSGFVDTMRVPLRGTPAYVYGAVRVLMRYRPPELRISGDFGEFERSVFLASTANTSTYGGAIPIVPQASPCDGWMDLCVIDRVSRLRALALIPTVMAGRHSKAKEVRFFRTKQLHIVAGEALPIWADGERLTQTPVTIEVAAAAVLVMLPGL